MSIDCGRERVTWLYGNYKLDTLSGRREPHFPCINCVYKCPGLILPFIVDPVTIKGEKKESMSSHPGFPAFSTFNPEDHFRVQKTGGEKIQSSFFLPGRWEGGGSLSRGGFGFGYIIPSLRSKSDSVLVLVRGDSHPLCWICSMSMSALGS